VLEVGSGPQVPTFRNSTYLDPQVGLTRDLGARHTMFEDFNLPFHGVLFDALIEDSCGPQINYDSRSTFDETSPFLTSPSFVVSMVCTN
jgi:hypothetical protein